jgi:SAM-dependent methyltransferase
MRISRLLFVVTRLWRYFNLYFLKPFDAVNDTLTASLLHRFDWRGSFVEIGSGDGVFSYIMHGGAFPLWFDRYLITDLSKEDIYDTHRSGVLPATRSLETPDIKLAIDAKPSHVIKIKEIGFASQSVVSCYERLPLPDNAVENIFYYTPHGLRDHEQAIREANRILKPGGRILILLYDEHFKSSFLCHRMSQFFGGCIGAYFANLDNGRYDEITKLAKSRIEWNAFFPGHGFQVEKMVTGLSTFAWKVYDVQTRPFLKPRIRFFNAFPYPASTFIKLSWMICWYPVLVLL